MSREHSLTRRAFGLAVGQSLAAVAAVRSVVADVPETREEWRPRYILGSSLYGTTPLAEILPEVAQTGADAIDIWPRVHGNQREQIEEMGHDRFEELLHQTKTRVGMVTHYDLGPKRVHEDFPFAKRFGAELVIIASGGPTGLVGDELKSAVRKFVEQMKPTIDKAGEQGLTIGVENHANALIESPDSIKWLAELSPSPNFGIAFAPYHLPQDANLLAGLMKGVGPERLVHFYAWQHGMGSKQKLPKEQELLQMPGRGELDFVPLMRELRALNYRRWVEIFMHPVPRGIPILETTAEVTREVNDGRRYLERCVAER